MKLSLLNSQKLKKMHQDSLNSGGVIAPNVDPMANGCIKMGRGGGGQVLSVVDSDINRVLKDSRVSVLKIGV